MFFSSSHNPIKKIIITLWLFFVVIGIVMTAWYLYHHSLESLLDGFIGVGVSVWSVGALLAVYVLRTIVFIPLSVVLMATPLVLGDFWAGLLVAGVGEIISASFQFWLARIYGRDFVEGSNDRTIKLIDEKITKFGSVSIAFLRLLPVPFDVINLGAGMTKMKFSDYFWVTVFSVWPDCLSYTAVGQAANNPLSLLYTVGITIAVFIIIWYLKDHPEYRDLITLEVEKKVTLVKSKLKTIKKKKKRY